MTTLEILKEARRRYVDGEFGWLKGTWFKPAEPEYPGKVYCCPVSACAIVDEYPLNSLIEQERLDEESASPDLFSAIELLADEIPAGSPGVFETTTVGQLIVYNDAASRNRSDIKALFDRAIAHLENHHEDNLSPAG